MAGEESDADHGQQGQANRNQRETKDLGGGQLGGRWRIHQILFKLPVIHQALVFHAVVMLEFLDREGAGKHDHFQRELVWPEVVVEEVNGEQELYRQERLFAMEDGLSLIHISEPTRRTPNSY